MPTQRLNIPEDLTYRSKAFRAVISHLQADGILQSVVSNWATWDGLDVELDVSLPTDTQCPWIRLTPFPEQQEPGAVDIDHAALVIMIELATEGTRVDNLMDLWEIVERRLNSDSQTVSGQDLHRYLQMNFRVHRTQIIRPSFGYVQGSSPAQSGMMYGRGAFHMFLDIPR